jgi:alpha-mannosidase
MVKGDCPNFRVSENGTVPFEGPEGDGGSYRENVLHSDNVFATASSVPLAPTRPLADRRSLTPMFNRLIALFPCQTLEDFDLERRERDAEQLLSSWSALWHPALLADAEEIPAWLPASCPPSEAAGNLILLPDCCESSLPDGWLAEAAAAGGCILRNLQHRDQIVTAALDRLGDCPNFRLSENGTVPLNAAKPNHPALDPDLAADFLALGHCYLQVELLTRKLRYMSNLDEAALQIAAVAAAREAVAGNPAAARQHLQSAFDRLHEAREYFYPIEARLLDLTLVAPTTLGQPLRDELSRSTSRSTGILPAVVEEHGQDAGATGVQPIDTAGLPCNLLVSADVIEEIARREPETLEALKKALAAGSVSLIGGERSETSLPLLDPEVIARHLAHGLAVYQQLLQQRPVIFGRRRFGLTPTLPQVLRRLGFVAAVHCTLDDGRFPTSDQSLFSWQGIDGTTIESLGCLPIDTNRAESFLSLPKKLSDSMSLDRTATVMFAHWPGRSSCWYEDLRRIAAYGSVLGSFSTLTRLLDEASSVGDADHYQPDEYRSPYLKQDVAAGRPDPISRWVRFFSRQSKSDATSTLTALAKLCRGLSTSAPSEAAQNSPTELTNRIEDALASDPDLDQELDAALEASLADFADSLTTAASSPNRGTLTVNPLSFEQAGPIPSLGFSWIDRDAPAAPPVERKGWFGRRPKSPPALAEQDLLRNEFCEVHFDPTTGAIRSITDYHSRDPRLAQQIALRLPHGGDPGGDANYSIMAADGIEVTSAGPTLGEVVCHGRLMDREGRRVAGFRQTTRIRRGSRVIELRIDLDVDRQPGSNPWDSYYACRFAWKDDTSTIHRGVGLANLPTELTQFESPHFVDIHSGKQQTTLLCGGLPYHRRIGLRKLDTLLAVRGETARSFRVGIGLDVPNPAAAAVAFLAPPLALPDQPPPPAPNGWLFHLDRRNVLATHWEASLPVADNNNHNSRELTAPGRIANQTAFRVRLLETEGRGVTLGLRCFRPVASAEKINAGDVPSVPLVMEGDRIEIPIGPHQWIEVEVVLS